jgi:hypothetical protein
MASALSLHFVFFILFCSPSGKLPVLGVQVHTSFNNLLHLWHYFGCACSEITTILKLRLHLDNLKLRFINFSILISFWNLNLMWLKYLVLLVAGRAPRASLRKCPRYTLIVMGALWSAPLQCLLGPLRYVLALPSIWEVCLPFTSANREWHGSHRFYLRIDQLWS